MVSLFAFSLSELNHSARDPLFKGKGKGKVSRSAHPADRPQLSELDQNRPLQQQVRIPVNVTADSGNVTGIPANVTGGRCCAF